MDKYWASEMSAIVGKLMRIVESPEKEGKFTN